MVINTILDRLKISYKDAGQHEYLISCQNKLHNDKSPSCHVNKETGLFHCKGCGFSGPIQRLIRYTQGDRAIEILEELRLTSSNPGILDQLVQSLLHPAPEQVKPKDFSKFNELTDIFVCGPQIDTKILSKKWFYFEGGTLHDEYQMKHWLKMGTYYNRVCFPIKDINGTIVNFIWRALDSQQKPKYLFLSHTECPMDKGEFIFYNNTILKSINKNFDYVFLVEGPFDAIYMDKLGYPAVSCFGTNITSGQYKKISQLTNSILIFLDNDDAGIDASRNMYVKMQKYCTDLNIFYPYNSQKIHNSNLGIEREIKNPWDVDPDIIVKHLSKFTINGA